MFCKVKKKVTKTLGFWLCTQRHAKKNGSLDKKYQHRPEEVDVQWVVQSTWDDMLHCLYNKTKEKDTERQAKENRKLYDGCQRKLNELGVLWKIRWTNMYLTSKIVCYCNEYNSIVHSFTWVHLKCYHLSICSKQDTK